jgi:uncharacterized membrane protein YeaQ/YmgE (transglycosylase-associated protein family)
VRRGVWGADVFAFFSNRLGCMGSLLVSVIGTIILLVLLRALSG